MRRRKMNSWLPKPLPHPDTVELVFDVEEVVNNISQLCGIVGESHDNATGGEANMTLTKDALEDGNRDIIMRGIDKTMKEIMMLLFPYTKIPLQTRYADNKIKEVTAYVIELTFDYERSGVQVMYLESQIHDYLVKKVVYDWLSYTMIPSQRVADVQMQQRKMLEESEFAKGNIITALAEPMEIKNHHVRAAFF